MSEKPANNLGLECPKCGCSDFRVYYTRDGFRVIKRTRICRNCDRRIVTMERIVGQPAEDESPREQGT